jgi:hypothetical protein
MPGAKVFACRDAIGGELSDNVLRKQCIEGDSKFRAALMAAGHLAPQPTTPVEATLAPPSQPEGKPSPESSLIAKLQERIDELEAVLDVKRGDGPFKAQKLAMAVAKKHGLKYSDLKSPRRQKHLVRARQEAMWLIRKECPGLSMPAIGRLFGGKDHTTVLHACRVHAKRIGHDPI